MRAKGAGGAVAFEEVGGESAGAADFDQFRDAGQFQCGIAEQVVRPIDEGDDGTLARQEVGGAEVHVQDAGVEAGVAEKGQQVGFARQRQGQARGRLDGAGAVEEAAGQFGGEGAVGLGRSGVLAGSCAGRCVRQREGVDLSQQVSHFAEVGGGYVVFDEGGDHVVEVVAEVKGVDFGCGQSVGVEVACVVGLPLEQQARVEGRVVNVGDPALPRDTDGDGAECLRVGAADEKFDAGGGGLQVGCAPVGVSGCEGGAKGGDEGGCLGVVWNLHVMGFLRVD